MLERQSLTCFCFHFVHLSQQRHLPIHKAGGGKRQKKGRDLVLNKEDNEILLQEQRREGFQACWPLSRDRQMAAGTRHTAHRLLFWKPRSCVPASLALNLLRLGSAPEHGRGVPDNPLGTWSPCSDKSRSHLGKGRGNGGCGAGGSCTPLDFTTEAN